MENDRIVALFHARAEDAISELDRKYGKLCRTLAYNIVGNREDAEECVNDAYLGAWNTIPPAQPDPLSTYICRLVRNQALKCCERRDAAKRGRYLTVPMEEIADCLAALHSVEEVLEAKDLARYIENFLDTLDVQNRVIFLRRYWFADSCRTIAVQVGLSEKLVTVRLTRLRKQLRAYLLEREVCI